jgi:hypothetical protein
LPVHQTVQEQIPDRTKRTRYQRQGNDPAFNLGAELYRIAGVDLTDIPGVRAMTAQVILTDIEPDVSRFRNASAFASWLDPCPEKRVLVEACQGTGKPEFLFAVAVLSKPNIASQEKRLPDMVHSRDGLR